MTATAHALIGGAIASSISNPAIALPLSAISHPLVDLIPHWDVGRDWRKKKKIELFLEASADLVGGFIISYLIFGRNIDFWYFFAVIFVAEVWDIIESPYWFFDWNFPPFSWVYQIQHRMQGRASFLPWGFLTQVVTVGLVIWILQIFT